MKVILDVTNMTTKNIQDVVAERVEKRVGAIIAACFYNDGTKKSVTDVIDVEVPALVADLTQLVKEVEAGEKERIIKEMNMFTPMQTAKKPKAYNEGVTSGWYAAKAFIQTLTPPTSDVIKK